MLVAALTDADVLHRINCVFVNSRRAYVLWACRENQWALTALSDIRRFCISPNCLQLMSKIEMRWVACFILVRARAGDFNPFRFMEPPALHLRTLLHAADDLQASYPQIRGSALNWLFCQVAPARQASLFLFDAPVTIS